MSNAPLDTSTGSWGILGTAKKSKVGRLRRAIEELPKEQLATKIPGVSGQPTEGRSYGTGSKITEQTKRFSRFENWYDKYRQRFLQDPIKDWYGTSDRTAWFRDPTPLEEEYAAEVGEAGTLRLPVGTGTIEAANIARETGRKAYWEEMDPTEGTIAKDLLEVETERAGKFSDIDKLEQDYDIQLRKAASERQGARAGQRGTAEAAEAAQASSGLEYTSAIERKFKDAAKAQGASMQDIADASRRAKIDKDIAVGNISEDIRQLGLKEEEIVGRREAAEDAFKISEEEYFTGIKNLYGTASTELDTAEGELDKLWSAHKGIGGASVTGSAKGAKTKFRDIPGKYFEESKGSIKQIQTAEDRLDASRDLSTRMAKYAQEQLQSIASGGYTPPYGKSTLAKK